MKNTWIASQVCEVPFEVLGMTIDDDGIIYYTCGYEGLWVVHPNSKKPQLLYSDKFLEMRGIIWDGRDHLYICAIRHEILQYDLNSGTLVVLCGHRKRTGSTDGAFADADFRWPVGIAMDSQGNLFVTDSKLIRKIILQEQRVENFAGSEDDTLYRDGSVKRATFKEPYSISMSADDTIYICDSSWPTLREIKSGWVRTIKLKHNLYNPSGVVVEADGNLIIADQRALYRIDLELKTMSKIPWVIKPHCMALEKSGNLYVYESNNGSCIMKLLVPWSIERLIWIGHMKEKPGGCYLASLPRDTIKEITAFHRS